MSRLLRALETETDRTQVLATVYRKLSRLPNTGLMEVWLQRIGHFYDFNPDYVENLCKLVTSKKTVLWNNDWITAKPLKKAVTPACVFNKAAFKAMKPLVPPSEVEMFATERY